MYFMSMCNSFQISATVCKKDLFTNVFVLLQFFTNTWFEDERKFLAGLYTSCNSVKYWCAISFKNLYGSAATLNFIHCSTGSQCNPLRTGVIILCLNIFFTILAINDILEDIENRVNGSLFADDLAIYITTRNQSIAGSDQQVECMGSTDGSDLSPQQNISKIFRKRNEEVM